MSKPAAVPYCTVKGFRIFSRPLPALAFEKYAVHRGTELRVA